MAPYDPSQAPAPAEWLEMDEFERIDTVLAWHEESDDPEPESGWQAHVAMHVAVENQLAQRVGQVPATLKRLRSEGLDRHDAIHAIASVLNEMLFEVVRENREFDPKRYDRALQRLKAKKWLRKYR